MRIVKTKDYDEMSRKAANIFFAQIVLKPDSVLGLATGSSVLGLYENLTASFKCGDLDFSEVKTVNLDEYAGLDGKNDQSYRFYMDGNLFSKVNIKKENTNLPDGLAKDMAAECARYNSLIESFGGVDIQLLGIGHNGHIGFNEPDCCFIKGTHVVDLSVSTIKANARFFADEKDVPSQAYTMGIQNIMQAKRIVLCVSGSQKAKILREALFGDVTPQVPGSVLQLHPDLIVVADEEALGGSDWV
ncbi:MAG: glucosamine-6-phosphate deaminase [Clostridiales bacterium]|nr:glucosamine-6-phosphate deaminase [Clostridiales bacterium]